MKSCGIICGDYRPRNRSACEPRLDEGRDLAHVGLAGHFRLHQPHYLAHVGRRFRARCGDGVGARKNKTRRALWEYDNILKSLYLLDYIDSLPLRQNVQRALNRGESYHQLRRAISYANFGKLRFKSELEQQLWSECGRLIANCILYYNASILSNVLAHRESIGDIQGVEVLKQISPVAWQHINLYGRYEFRKCSEPIDLDDIVRQLTQVQSY